MDISRASEIVNSSETIEVLHNGSPVWIESISSENNTALVKPLDGRGKIREISITELVEG